ncbi:MAG: hypothetical protein RLZZ373_3544, partial [Pseudomonadota bacterium]
GAILRAGQVVQRASLLDQETQETTES